MHFRLDAVALGLLVTAGCLAPTHGATGAPTSAQDARDPVAAIKALMQGVPCQASVDYTKTSDNLKRLANFTFQDGQPWGSRELDIKGDLGLTTLSGYAGIGLFSIKDPLHPLQLSTLKTKGELDVKFSPDNTTAFVGVSGGIAIVDIRDPADPVLTSTWTWDKAPSPPRGEPGENAHMLYTAHIAGKDWLFLAPNSNSGVWVFAIGGVPGAVTLTFVTNTLPVEGGVIGPHDMWVHFDEVLHQWLLYSADGYHGWTVFNVNDPTKPQLVGGIEKPEGGYTHTIQAAKIGERRIVATIQEVGENVLEVYDATNLRAPVLLATWQFQAGSTYPQHNFNIVAGRLYMAHYANGIFVFDLNTLGSTPLASQLTPVAHYSHSDPSAADPAGFSGFYDVVVKDGVVYGASDGADTKGIHVIGDGCLDVGDASLVTTG